MKEIELKTIIKSVLEETSNNSYLSVGRVTELLGFKNPETIRRKCKSGELPAKKFGKSWKISQTDFNNFCQ